MHVLEKLLYRGQHTCPWWLCFTFDNPLRRRLQNPDLILKDLVQQGQTALDIGCGMGYFSIALARAVGPSGKVICIDMQDKMLEAVRRKAKKAGLNNIQLHRCGADTLGLTASADFALAFWMVHEVLNQPKFLVEVRDSLRPGGAFLIVEPKLHVALSAFKRSIAAAEAAGLRIIGRPNISMSRAVLLGKP